MMTTKKGYSQKYLSHIRSPEWYGKTRVCKNLNDKHCVLFPWLRARHCHHLHYRNLGKEFPIIDIVPLSETAHKLVHLKLLWKQKSITKVVNFFLRIFFISSIFFWNLVRLWKFIF